MRPGLYRCVNCRGGLSLNHEDLSCGNCGETYAVVNDIPYFIPEQLPSQAGSLGLASRLFESPLLYDWLVSLKTLVAPDRKLGIRDLTDGRSLLNIGCGSNVESKHLEYDIHALSDFAAVDVSPNFVETAKKNCSRRDVDFCVASVDKLPYDDSSFDVVIIPFVLHHLPFPVDIAIGEALRVAKRQVVIYDHMKSGERGVVRAVQELYWRVFDGGYQYLTSGEWEAALKGRKITRSIHTGAIGKHVFKFVLEKGR